MLQTVYIIILNWNGTDDTIGCINSVLKSDYENFQIILIDNGSNTEEFERLYIWCEQNFKLLVKYGIVDAVNGGIEQSEYLLSCHSSSEKIILIKNGENLGFAKGNNVGLHYVVKKMGEFALILNNDTEIRHDSIKKLIESMTEYNYVAVTPQIRYYSEPEKIWNCGGRITWFGNRRYYHAREKVNNVPQHGTKRVTFITGCALMIKPSETGLLTEKFFFGEEDMEFCYRQKKAKKKMGCCYDSIIYHKVSSSVKKHNPNVLGSVYIHYLSRFIDMRNYSSPLFFPFLVFINLCYALPMIVVRYKISFRPLAKMLITLLRELSVLEGINKEYCIKYLKTNFKS